MSLVEQLARAVRDDDFGDGHTRKRSEWIGPLIPLVLPNHWRVVALALDGVKWASIGGLTVIASGATESDGKRWWHVSVAHPRRLPTYDDLVEVKRMFVGAERKAVQVFAPASQHVNIHANCLHLFSCVDEDVLPDFTRGGRTL